MGSFNPYYMYGLTATPYRRDNLEQLMFQTVGPINYSVPMEAILDYGGIIVPTVIKRNVVSPKVIVSDNYQKIIKELVYDTHRNRMIVDDVTQDAEAGNICVVLTDRKVHAEVLYNIIRAVWPKTAIATGNYSKKYVKEQIQKLESGEITVLIATGEGFDYAPLNRCYLGLPFRNQTKIEQIIGRIQRPAEGKTDAILYDYVDSHGLLKHQFYNTGSKGCRYDVYRMLGADVRQG
jgi:superfamily II DNA or RNA helicase